MSLLLDTHVFLWMQTRPERLGEARELAEDASQELLVSAVSAWEIAIKYAADRLPLPESPASYVPDRIRAIGATALPITHADALAVADLPPIHRDPFDRLLVAQAAGMAVPLLTADAVLAAYPIETVLI